MKVAISSDLKRDLESMIANHSWIADCLAEKRESFPFRPDKNGKAETTQFLSPDNPSTSYVESFENTPQFIVNIPMAHRPDLSVDYTYLFSRLEILKNEAYGRTSKNSCQEINRSVAIVIGINQVWSIDHTVNRTFIQYIQKLPKVEGIVHRVIGFFWKPVWVKKGGPLVYSISKAFHLLKALSSITAEEVRKEYETPLHPKIVSQIPFQKIRETIKNAAATRGFVEHAQKHALSSSIYYVVMDADFLALRKKIGIFSRLKSHIIARNNPSVVCLGYQMADSELPLIRLGVKVDMAVRKAMCSVVPYSAYFCEPCTAFIVRRPTHRAFLHQLTFIGRGRTLETRLLVESGLKKGLFDENVVYETDGGVTTTTPARMYTIKNRKFRELAFSQIKQKRCLQALRAIPQTHAMPKQWSENLYNGLGFSCSRVTDATTPMMRIFNVFDPISRMFSVKTKFSKTVVDEIIKGYDKSLSKVYKDILSTSRVKLSQLGMKKPMIDKIEEAARKSGKAILDILIQATSSHVGAETLYFSAGRKRRLH